MSYAYGSLCDIRHISYAYRDICPLNHQLVQELGGWFKQIVGGGKFA